MRIRPFKPEDEEAVVALWQECQLARPWNDPHKDIARKLAVAPAFRGRGFGRAMMQHVEAALTERGCPKLNLQVRKSNGEAVAFYRHLGYVEDESLSLGKRLIAD
jgi:GNAT superfamily N-acetyltransferase